MSAVTYTTTPNVEDEISRNLTQAIGICHGIGALLREHDRGEDTDGSAWAVRSLLERVQYLRACITDGEFAPRPEGSAS